MKAATMDRKNVIRFGAARYGERIQGAYGDRCLQHVPFKAEPGLTGDELFNRLAWAVIRKFKARNGYEARLLSVDEAAGELVIQHYHGLAD